MKVNLKTPSAKWRPFYFGVNALRVIREPGERKYPETIAINKTYDRTHISGHMSITYVRKCHTNMNISQRHAYKSEPMANTSV